MNETSDPGAMSVVVSAKSEGMMMTSPQSAIATDATPARSRDEWDLRVQLAAAYRIFDHLGWCELIYGHISMRVPGPEHHFLINPYGLRYDEVKASNLIKIDLDGNHVESDDYSFNPAGFVIHSAIHANSPDAHCVMHSHTRAGMAVAALECGLLPISMNATSFHKQLAYHDYEGAQLLLDERENLVRDLGSCQVMILRNHGLLTVGRTIPEAFLLLYRLERACQVQIDAMSCGRPLVVPPEPAIERSAEQLKEVAEHAAETGKLEFDALLRLMDKLDPSFRE